MPRVVAGLASSIHGGHRAVDLDARPMGVTDWH